MEISKIRKKFRGGTIRLTTWNYKSEGGYMITINVKDRKHSFGKIQNGEMKLSNIGQIALEEWIKTPEIRLDMNLILDEFVVMPDHFHAIIVIGSNQHNQDDEENRTFDNSKKQFIVPRKNLSSIIRGFKSAVTSRARKIDPNFSWQRKFYEQIIRNDGQLENFRNYIMENPKRWTNNP